MTVNELIEQLQKIEDKNLVVYCDICEKELDTLLHIDHIDQMKTNINLCTYKEF